MEDNLDQNPQAARITALTNHFISKYKGRKRKDTAFQILIYIPAVIVIAILIAILVQVVVRGAPAINFDFLTKQQKPFGETGGGVVQAIVGTFLVILVATIIAFPLGLGTSLYLYEHKGTRKASMLLNAVDTLQGVPSIVVGVVIYSWVVAPMKTFSALGRRNRAFSGNAATCDKHDEGIARHGAGIVP